MRILKKDAIFYEPKFKYGYFAWPSIVRYNDMYVVVCSGYRQSHVDIHGKTVMFLSENGTSWSEPFVINDRPYTDERDSGVVVYNGVLIVTWFTGGGKGYRHAGEQCLRFTHDLDSWSNIHQIPIASPHGPIVHKNKLLFLGKHQSGEIRMYDIQFKTSDPFVYSEHLGTVPTPVGTTTINWQEPHCVGAFSDLIGYIRFQRETSPRGYESEFSIYWTISTNNGKSWTEPQLLISHGSPPHMTSEYPYVLSYGYRRRPYGVRVRIDGIDRTIEKHMADVDCGYPSTVKASEDKFLTVYYGKRKKTDKAGIFYCLWEV